MIHIHPHRLLWVYASIFLAGVLIVCDLLLNSGNLRDSLPNDPNEFLLFTLIFTLPHIMASFFSFADREYINFYGKRLLHGAQAVIVAAIALPLISQDLTFLVFALLTMTHVFLQQSGVTKSIMKGANRFHTYWQWLSVLIAFILYITVYADYFEVGAEWHWIVMSLIAIQTGLGLRAAEASKTSTGTQFFWSTHLLVVCSYVFIVLGYPILAIAVPRIVHDLTAFYFYIAHDHNRLQDAPRNLIFSNLKRLKIPVVIASPILAITLAYPFQYSSTNTDLFILSMFVFLYHYYVESFIWKKGTLHRRYATPL